MRWQKSGVQWILGDAMQVWVCLLPFLITSQTLPLSELQFPTGHQCSESGSRRLGLQCWAVELI